MRMPARNRMLPNFGHCLVEYKDMRFLIMDRPSKANIVQFVEVYIYLNIWLYHCISVFVNPFVLLILCLYICFCITNFTYTVNFVRIIAI